MVAGSGCCSIFYLQGDFTNYFKLTLLSNLRLSKYACTCGHVKKNEIIQMSEIRLFISEPIKLHLQFLYILKTQQKTNNISILPPHLQQQHTSTSVQTPQQDPTISAGPAQPRRPTQKYSLVFISMPRHPFLDRKVSVNWGCDDEQKKQQHCDLHLKHLMNRTNTTLITCIMFDIFVLPLLSYLSNLRTIVSNHLEIVRKRFGFHRCFGQLHAVMQTLMPF